MDVLDRAEERRKTSRAGLKPDEQAAFGQYFTPYQAARIIAADRVPRTARVFASTGACCASDPTHNIHLNGDRFLGPYDASL